MSRFYFGHKIEYCYGYLVKMLNFFSKRHAIPLGKLI